MQLRNAREDLGYIKPEKRPSPQWSKTVLNKEKRSHEVSPLLQEWMKEQNEKDKK